MVDVVVAAAGAAPAPGPASCSAVSSLVPVTVPEAMAAPAVQLANLALQVVRVHVTIATAVRMITMMTIGICGQRE